MQVLPDRGVPAMTCLRLKSLPKREADINPAFTYLVKYKDAPSGDRGDSQWTTTRMEKGEDDPENYYYLTGYEDEEFEFSSVEEDFPHVYQVLTHNEATLAIILSMPAHLRPPQEAIDELEKVVQRESDGYALMDMLEGLISNDMIQALNDGNVTTMECSDEQGVAGEVKSTEDLTWELLGGSVILINFNDKEQKILRTALEKFSQLCDHFSIGEETTTDTLDIAANDLRSFYEQEIPESEIKSQNLQDILLDLVSRMKTGHVNV